MPNPYLYNRDQKDLQTLQSVLGLMDYFEKRKQLKQREGAIGSLPEGLKKYYQVTGGFPTTDKPDALARALGIEIPEEESKAETPEQKRIRFGEFGQVPIDREFQQETGFKPTETGFENLRPLDVQSTIEGVNRLKKRGLEFLGQTPSLPKFKEPTTYAPTEFDKIKADFKRANPEATDLEADIYVRNIGDQAAKVTRPMNAQDFEQGKLKFFSNTPPTAQKLSMYWRTVRKSNPAVADSMAAQDLGPALPAESESVVGPLTSQDISGFAVYPSFEIWQKAVNSSPKWKALDDRIRSAIEAKAKVWFAKD